MAWSYNISSLIPSGNTINVFGQLQFSGSYTTGGDAAGAFNIGGNTAGLPQFTLTSGVHAALPPTEYNVQLDGGYLGVVIPGAGAALKIKVINPATGAELAAGAYPAALTSAVYHTMQLAYLKNL